MMPALATLRWNLGTRAREELAFPTMLSLRHAIDRGRRHPLLGPLCLLLLLLLLVMTAMHGAHDQMHGNGSGQLIVCVALLIGALVSLLSLSPRAPDSVFARTSRGPPSRPHVRAQFVHDSFFASPAPLRL